MKKVSLLFYMVFFVSPAWSMEWGFPSPDDDRNMAYCGKVCFAVGPNVQKTDINPYRGYCNDAPQHRILVTGANLAGRCYNARCKLNGEYIWMKVGKEEYLIRDGKYCVQHKFPECKNDITVRDWGFSECSFKIFALKREGIRVERPWCRADGRLYVISMDDLGDAEYKTVKVLYRGPKESFPQEEDL